MTKELTALAPSMMYLHVFLCLQFSFSRVLALAPSAIVSMWLRNSFGAAVFFYFLFLVTVGLRHVPNKKNDGGGDSKQKRDLPELRSDGPLGRDDKCRAHKEWFQRKRQRRFRSQEGQIFSELPMFSGTEAPRKTNGNVCSGFSTQQVRGQ